MNILSHIKPLTAVALLCRTAAWFPLWMLVLALSQPEPMLLAASGILLAGGLLCQLWHRFLAQKIYSNSGRVFRLNLLGLLLLTGGCGALVWLVTHRLFSSVLLSCVTLPALSHGADRDPEQLWTMPHFAAHLTGAVVGGVLLSTTDLHVSAALLPAVMLCACGFLLLRNQTMLIRLVSRRSTGEAEVPAEIRRSNLMLVLGCILLCAAVLLLRRPLSAMLGMLGNALKTLVRLLLLGLSRLTAWLGGNAPAEPTAPEDSDGAAQILRNEGSALWSLLLLPLIPVVVHIWKQFIGDWIFDISEWLRDFLARLRGGRAVGAAGAGEASEFTDTEELARPQQNADRSQKRHWLRDYRRWRKKPDSAEKFYDGYALMCQAPAWGDTPPAPSDTALEIAGKRAGTLDAVTEALHKNRYAQQPLPDSAVTEIGAVLEEMTRG